MKFLRTEMFNRFYQLYSFVSTLYVKNSKFYCVEFERKPAPRFVRFVRLRVAILRTVGTGRYVFRVAGWNLIITGKLKRNVQAVDLPWLLQDDVYDRSVRLLPPNAKPAEAMAGGYIPMISSLQWIVSFEETSEISSKIAAEFGFYPCEYTVSLC